MTITNINGQLEMFLLADAVLIGMDNVTDGLVICKF